MAIDYVELARKISEKLNKDHWGLIDPSFFEAIGNGYNEEDWDEEDLESIKSLEKILSESVFEVS